jgi:cell division protein FtsI/penicillin-binding protein 2
MIFVSALLAIFMLVVVGKLFRIQVMEGKKYAERSRSQVQQRRLIKSKRGDIYDRRGRQLAASVPGPMALDLEALGVEGERGKAVLQRVYPMGDLAGPVIGYVGKDGYGFGGIEFAFDHYLRGEDGWEMVYRDGKQRTYSRIGLPAKEPRDGSDVYLTIDANLQKIVQSVLKQTVDSLNAKGAMCIVMDPHSGKILAMANEPSFNPNVPMSFTLADRQNKCISLVYEPGSTFKAMTAAVALQEKMINEDDLVDGNNGVFEIYGEVIRDEFPQQEITFSRALAVSSNVCFARVANGFRNDQFYRYIRDFGFGAKTGVSLPGEEDGILHRVNSWSGRTRITMSYGYEVSATFLQMMLAYASIVNGGVLLTPIINERIEDKNGTVIQSAEVKPVRRVMSQETAVRLRRMMKEVVETGTGRQASVSGIAVAGKTGTSRKHEAGGYSRTKHWSSFIGFIPVETPTLLCGVVIDEPASGAGGGAVAAPAFRKIISQALAHPELEFSDKILTNIVSSREQQTERVRTPDLTGHRRGSVSHQLDSMNITFRFVGEGDVIRHQVPAAGSFMGTKVKEIVLFTDEREFGAESAVKIVPDCVGKDLRDAFNLMNASGVPVHVIGKGIVKKQSIAPGEILKSEAVCTLYTK